MTDSSDVVISIESLRTNRLLLHPLDPTDAPEMVGILDDPILYHFTGGEPPGLETLERRYRAQVNGPAAEDEDEVWFNWIVRTAEDERAIGFVQATMNDGEADVAWLVGVAFQCRGFASEAARAMCEWLTGNGVSRLTAHIHPDHAASQRVAAAIGLSETGETDHEGEAIWALSQASTRNRRTMPGTSTPPRSPIEMLP